MSAYKKVIVAIDLEGGAGDVLAQATTLLEGTDADVTVLNVPYDVVQMYGASMGAGIYSTANLDLDNDQIRKSIEEKIQALVDEYHVPKCEVVVNFGRPVDLILKHAEAQNADLILMGSHGRHGLGLLLGSTANGVLHRAKCDVLAVRVGDKS